MHLQDPGPTCPDGCRTNLETPKPKPRCWSLTAKAWWAHPSAKDAGRQLALTLVMFYSTGQSCVRLRIVMHQTPHWQVP